METKIETMAYLIDCQQHTIKDNVLYKLIFWTEMGLTTIWSNTDYRANKVSLSSVELGAKPRMIRLILSDRTGKNKLYFHGFVDAKGS